MKKILWAVSCIPLIGTAIMLQFLPERVPMHYDLAGNIDRWGSKYEALLFPVIILLFALFWHLFISYFEKKAANAIDEKAEAEAVSNAKVMKITGLLMAVVFTVMHGFSLYSAYKEALSGSTKQAVDIGKVSVILMGVIIFVLGNFMTKTRNNGLVGFRIRWSMYNDTTWRKSNRFSAIGMMIAGILIIILAVVMKSSVTITLIALGLIILVAIVSAIYAHKVYLQEIEKEKNDGIR